MHRAQWLDYCRYSVPEDTFPGKMMIALEHMPGLRGRKADPLLWNSACPLSRSSLRPFPTSTASFGFGKQAFLRQITCIRRAPSPSRVRGWTRPPERTVFRSASARQRGAATPSQRGETPGSPRSWLEGSRCSPGLSSGAAGILLARSLPFQSKPWRLTISRSMKTQKSVGENS